jgi:hypothetical protein
MCCTYTRDVKDILKFKTSKCFKKQLAVRGLTVVSTESTVCLDEVPYGVAEARLLPEYTVLHPRKRAPARFS